MKKSLKLAVAMMLALGVNVIALPHAEASITSAAKTGIERIEVQSPVPVKILADYRKQGYSGLLDYGTFTNIDDAKINAARNKQLDGYADLSKQACTAIVKPLIINGKKTVVMGRNMDLPTSNYPAYIFRIDQPGKYKTLNIGYLNRNIESFPQIAETSTVDKRMYDNATFQVTDVMNEKGLMLEANMRGTCLELASKGTNPGKFRIADSMLARYLADHCANIEEMLHTINELDVFTAYSKYWSWYTTLVVADASGRYGVLEFVKNKAVWHESYPGQANFWIDREARKIAPNNMGYGRWAKAMQKYNHVKTTEDMKKLISSIHYSPLFYEDSRNIGYDVASDVAEENINDDLEQIKGWIKDYGIKVSADDLQFLEALAKEQKEKNLVWTDTWCTDPDNLKTVYRFIDIVSRCMKQLPASAHRLSGKREMSSISYVANPIEKVYHVQFFETGEVFNFGFDGLTKTKVK